MRLADSRADDLRQVRKCLGSKQKRSKHNNRLSVRQSQKVQYANSRWPFVMGKQRLADIFNLHIEPFGSDVQKYLHPMPFLRIRPSLCPNLIESPLAATR